MPQLKSTLLLPILIFSFFSFSQSSDVYNALLVPTELKEKANAVVRYDSKKVIINDYNDMEIISKRIITIYNKEGIDNANTYEYYSNDTEIKKIELKIFDSSGEEIKKIKKGDFTDRSAVSGGTLYSDNRVMFYDYIPVNYPYTIEFKSEVHHESTSYLPSWMPIDGYYLSVQYSELKIENYLEEKINFKSQNFDNIKIEKVSEYYYKATNLPSIKYEAYSPKLSLIAPKLSFALDKFIISGVEGRNGDWKSQGKWMYDNMLKDKLQLSETTKNIVLNLVKDIEDPIEKAKVIYNYVQQNTRYISVQEGIGGMQPINALIVDEVKYGDCKGLSNYTKALLSHVGVESYYTRLYGSRKIQNVDKDFVSFQGQTNHVILALPDKEDYIFLECTSQTNPFGFTAGFTDDRDVLLIKPDGGEIVHTKIYRADDSVQKTTANIQMDATGSFTADVRIETTGFQYSLHEGIERKTERDQHLYYKEYWANINNLTINSIDINNDKDNVIYSESVKLSSMNYASKSGNRLIFQPNMFNKVTQIPPRYTERKLEFKIDRAFKDVDEFIIHLPEGIEVEAMTDFKEVKTKFGSYKFNIEALEGNKLKYTRTYILLKGNYTKEDYKAFRDFRKQIVKHDKSKIVLIQS
ncbi:DUF3857 domain-containing protein [Winogradskyella endarachnes]|uniref:DUF3857 domain-containing protein n=1 Tax=Winogradskyella endarachnes TaxID=2681965 RepID=A0A6L6U6H9_9FLAO|nr:DUF3857 domain-containing protein [Winogradskyella endarachnes]MUU77845.1 DUF3857 domain-containing protein [Winogradskyella endarachnes]